MLYNISKLHTDNMMLFYTLKLDLTGPVLNEIDAD